MNRSTKAPIVFWPKEMPPQLAAVMPLGQRHVSNTGCNVLVNIEPLGPNGENEYHLSISHQARYPTWDEIAEARYKFLPDALTFAMVLPPKGEYVNVHENTFHLHELHDRREILVKP